MSGAPPRVRRSFRQRLAMDRQLSCRHAALQLFDPVLHDDDPWRRRRPGRRIGILHHQESPAVGRYIVRTRHASRGRGERIRSRCKELRWRTRLPCRARRNRDPHHSAVRSAIKELAGRHVPIRARSRQLWKRVRDPSRHPEMAERTLRKYRSGSIDRPPTGRPVRSRRSTPRTGS